VYLKNECCLIISTFLGT